MLLYYTAAGAALAGGPLLARRPQYRRGFLLATGLCCWLLASLRYVTGFDYRSYETIFRTIAAAGPSVLLQEGRLESGYVLLNVAAALLGGGYRAFLFLFHFILTALVFAWIERYSPSPWMSVYLFVTLQYLALSMNLLRQALAAAVVLWTYPFLKSRRFLPFCGVVLLAGCFHRTALVMIPLYFLLTLRVSKVHYGISALLAGSAYVLLDPLMNAALSFFPAYRGYIRGRYWQSNSFVYMLFPLCLFLYTLPLIKQAAREPGKSPVLANCAFYSLLLQLFITRHFILERFSIYTAFFSLLSLPEAALGEGRRISPKGRTALLAAGALAYFLFAAREGVHGVYPYHGVWERALPR